MSAPSWWDTWNHPPRWLAWFQVFITIIGNIVGGSLLSKSEGFTRIPFAIGSTLSYLIAFYFLAVAMRSLPVSTSYPLQIAGVVSGTVFVGLVLYGEEVSVAKLIAVMAIIVGAAILERKPELRPELERELLARQQSTTAPRSARLEPAPKGPAMDGRA